jgi:hypothetical protein
MGTFCTCEDAKYCPNFCGGVYIVLKSTGITTHAAHRYIWGQTCNRFQRLAVGEGATGCRLREPIVQRKGRRPFLRAMELL